MGELATRIRAKYPGAYDSIDDATLESKVVAKYPGVYDHLVAPSNNPADYPQGKSVSEAERMRREFIRQEKGNKTTGEKLQDIGIPEYLNPGLPTDRATSAGDFASRVLPESAGKLPLRLVQGAYEAIKGQTDPVVEGFTTQFNNPNYSIGQEMRRNAVGTLRGLADSVVNPTGLMGLEKAKESWLTDPAGSALAIAPMVKPSLRALKPGAVTEIGKSIAEATRPSPTELQRLSREHNVPLPFGEEVNSPTAKFVEAKLERLPVIGIRGAMKKGGESLAAAAKNIADEFATASEDPATTLVDRYKSNLKKGKDLASEAYGKISDALAENGDPGAIDPKATRGQLQSLLAKSPDIFDRLPGSQNEIKSIMNKILDSTTAKNTNTISSGGTKLSVSPPVIDPITRQPIASTVNLGTVEGMAGEGGISAGRSGKVTIPETDVIYGGRTKPIKLTYDDYTALRTKLGEYIDRAASSAGALGSNELRQLTIIKKALDQDFYNWGKNSGYENVTAAVDNARKVYKENVAPFENVPILKQIINDKFTPEQLLDAIAKPGHATLATRAMKGLAERDKALVQDAIMRRALAIGTEGAREGTPISGAKYATFFEKMDTKTKNAAQSPMDVFFSPQQKQRVMGFAKLARAAERYGQYSANPLTGIQGADFAIPSAIGATAGVVGAPAAIASAAFTKAMSLMLTTEAGKAILHRAYRLPDGASAAWQSILQQTSKYLKDERGLVGRDINNKSIERNLIKGEDGEPVTFYHGTNQNISEFEKGDIGYHFGTEYQANQRLIKKFGDNTEGQNIIPVHLAIKNPLRLRADVGSFDYPPDVLSTKKIQEVLGMDFINKERATRKTTIDQLQRKYMVWRNGDLVPKNSEAIKLYNAADKALDQGTLTRIRQALQAKGYDGIVYPNSFEGSGDSYIAFTPNQIISKFKK